MGLGVEGAGSKNCKRWAALSANPNSRGKSFLLGESGTVVPLFTGVASTPSKPFPTQWSSKDAHHH